MITKSVIRDAGSRDSSSRSRGGRLRSELVSSERFEKLLDAIEARVVVEGRLCEVVDFSSVSLGKQISKTRS
jgi:hypothetical protein